MTETDVHTNDKIKRFSEHKVLIFEKTKSVLIF